MKYFILASISAFFTLTQTQVCAGLKIKDSITNKCVCPDPLISAPYDLNCYCGWQTFREGPPVKVLAQQNQYGSYNYTCKCYDDEDGEQRNWDPVKKACVSGKIKIQTAQDSSSSVKKDDKKKLKTESTLGSTLKVEVPKVQVKIDNVLKTDAPKVQEKKNTVVKTETPKVQQKNNVVQKVQNKPRWQIEQEQNELNKKKKL